METWWSSIVRRALIIQSFYALFLGHFLFVILHCLKKEGKEKMKKIAKLLCLVLVLVLAASLFSGCSQKIGGNITLATTTSTTDTGLLDFLYLSLQKKQVFRLRLFRLVRVLLLQWV
jgi:hypothetical protein